MLTGPRLAGFDAPSVAAAKEFGQVTGAALGLDVGDLLVDYIFVAWEVVPGAEYADGSWEALAVLHVGEKEGVGRARVVGVVNDEIRFGNAIA